MTGLAMCGDVAARCAHIEGWEQALDWGMVIGTPVLFKQTGNDLARELGLKASKGDDIEDVTRISGTIGDVAVSCNQAPSGSHSTLLKGLQQSLHSIEANLKINALNSS